MKSGDQKETVYDTLQPRKRVKSERGQSSELAAVERTDEDNLVAVLQDIVAFALELPVAVVDQHEDARTTVESASQPKANHRKASNRSAWLAQNEEPLGVMGTYTESPSTKSSSRSVMRFLRM